MIDLEVLKILKKLEEEEVIVSYSYYEEEEVKFLVETHYSDLSVRKAHKLDVFFKMLDELGVDYYELKVEECE